MDHSPAKIIAEFLIDEALLTAKRTGKNQIHLAGHPDEESTSPIGKDS